MFVGLVVIGFFLVGILVFFLLFYPQQSINPIEILDVHTTTPVPDKYHDDVLHPCIRKMSDGRYVMVQSPWYKCEDGIENPIMYISDDPIRWNNGIVVADTPAKGYNSDPNVYEEDGRIYVFWREVETPFCDAYNTRIAMVGVYTDDNGKTFSNKQLYIANDDLDVDTIMCPIVLKKEDKYRVYAVWYQIWRKNRHNIGISIWEGTCLEKPDFRLLKQVPFKTKYICDKYKQLKLFGHLFFIPQPHKFDLWHFDLLEKNGLLYMFASEEMADVEMVAISEDWEHFTLNRKPLINAHYMENHVGYRQVYYKPTAFVREDGRIQYYYTSNRSNESYTYCLHSAIFES